jgi:hypothetical protein
LRNTRKQTRILSRGISKNFNARQGALEVLRDVELEVLGGEFCWLVDPLDSGNPWSGSGVRYIYNKSINTII